MRTLTVVFMAFVASLALAQQELPNLIVTVNDGGVELKPVLIELNEYLVPLRDSVRLFTEGKGELGVEASKAYTISENGQVLVRIPMQGKGSSALIYAPGQTQPIRTLAMEDFPRSEKGTTVIDLDLLAACLGVTVDIDGKKLALYTPDFWCKKIGISAEKAEGRTLKNIAILPDFGISPPAKSLLFWVRPPVESYVQTYRIGEEGPTPLLGVSVLDEEVTILGPRDRAKARPTEPGNAVRAETYNYGTEVGKVQNYVAIVLKKDTAYDDPVALINSGAIPDGEWAVIGIRQRAGKMPVRFDNVEVKANEDQGAFAARTKTTVTLLRTLNGLRPGEKLKAKSKLTIMAGFDDAALAAMQKAPYKITGLYEVQPGESVATISKKWGVKEDELLAANSSITPGGEPEPGDLINIIESTATEPEEQPTPQTKAEIVQNTGIPYQGSAYIMSSVALRQTSGKSSASVGQGKVGKIVELVTFMPEQKMYCVKMDGVMGYLPESAIKTRVGAGPLGGSDPNNNIVAREALKYIGTPYVWGGNGLTTGIDCSHFVAQVYERIGWRPVPQAPVLMQERTGEIVHFKPGQARRAGQTIILPNPVLARRATSDFRALTPGDRIIFQRGLTDASGTRHTAVYIGKVPKAWQARFGDIPYAFVHASSSRGVTVSSLTQKYYWNVYKFTVRSAHTNASADTGVDDGIAAAFGVGR